MLFRSVKCVAHKKGEDYSIDLIGNATYEYKVTINVTEAGFDVTDKTNFEEEAESYRLMLEDANAYLQLKLA